MLGLFLAFREILAKMVNQEDLETTDLQGPRY